MFFDLPPDQVDRSRKYPFVAAFSEILRLTLTACPNQLEKVSKIAEDNIIVIEEERPEIAESLKQKFAIDVLNLRQIDIKDDDQNVILKTFVLWNHEYDCWVILLELGHEDYWENRHKRIVGKG